MENLLRNRCGKLSQPIREMFAEMMGTFILVIFGVGSVAQYAFGMRSLSITFLSVNFGWGVGVMLGIYWAAGVSGAHLNPAVTLAMTVFGRLPVKKLPLYWIGQTLGAFIASAICYGLYHDLLNEFEPERTLATAGIWSTYPAKGVSHGTVFGDQLVGTALLVGCIFALTDKRNNAPPASILPICVGFVVLVIGISFGINCGYGINPARDLIPRIFTSMAGWKSAPFKANDYYFWVPVIGQLIGGVVGALMYFLAIELHHPENETTPLVETYTTSKRDSAEESC